MIRTLTLFLCSLAVATAALAQFDSPVWYVEYEVITKGEHTASGDGVRGPTSTTSKVLYSFSGSSKLDMRNMGQVLSMDYSAMDSEKMKNMSQAEAMKMSQQMLEAMQNAANWMPGPLDVGEAQDAILNHMLAVSVPIRIDYEQTTTGNNLPDETGGRYDYWAHTTATANGGKVYLGDQVKFEMNSASKKYWLVLPHHGQDMNTAGNDLKWVSVSKTRATGTTAWENEEQKTRETSPEALGQVKFEGTPGTLITGTYTDASRISGEQTFPGRLGGGQGGEFPVTVTYRYRLTTAPPATAKK